MLLTVVAAIAVLPASSILESPYLIKAAEKVERVVVVDKQKQRVIAYQDGKEVLNFHCSTARKGKITPTGTYRIYEKDPIGWALAELGGAKLTWVIRFNGRILIHGYHSVPDYPASSGCIRLSVSDAKKLYDFVQIGDTIRVVNKM